MATIAILLAADFEDSEFQVPAQGLREKGHDLVVLGAKPGVTVEDKRGKERVPVERSAGDEDPALFDALVIPGGYSPDHLRTDRGVVDFVRRFAATGKPIAAVCHGPQLLIEADAVEGKRMTSWPSVRKDLENAGAHWVDEEVVEDGALITSRKPDDLEAFTNAIVRRLERVATGPRS